MAETHYTETHEWARKLNGEALIGLSDHAQKELGEIVYLDITVKKGETLTKGKVFAVIESVKAASEIYAPVSGEVTEINQQVIDNTSLVNSSAEKDAWMVKVKLAEPAEFDGLMDEKAYKTSIGEG